MTERYINAVPRIGISAVAAVLEATAPKSQNPVPSRKEIPAILRGEVDGITHPHLSYQNIYHRKESTSSAIGASLCHAEIRASDLIAATARPSSRLPGEMISRDRAAFPICDPAFRHCVSNTLPRFLAPLSSAPCRRSMARRRGAH